MKIKKWLKKHAKKLVAVACGVFLAFCSIVAFLPNSAPVNSKAEGRYDNNTSNLALNHFAGLELHHSIGVNNTVTNTLPEYVYLSDYQNYNRVSSFGDSWRFRDNISFSTTSFYRYVSATNTFTSSSYGNATGQNSTIFYLSFSDLFVPEYAIDDLLLTYNIFVSGGSSAAGYYDIVENATFLSSNGESTSLSAVYTPGLSVRAFSSMSLSSAPIVYSYSGVNYYYIQSYSLQFRMRSNISSFPSFTSSFNVLVDLNNDFDDITAYTLSLQNFWKNTFYIATENAAVDRVGAVFRGVIENFFNIEIFPNFRLSYLIMLSIGVVLFGFALKFFLGG